MVTRQARKCKAKLHEADGSIEEALCYGASFLARVGNFQESRRVWTDQDFRAAEGVRRKINAFLEEHYLQRRHRR